VNTTVSDTSRKLRLGQAQVESIVTRWVSPTVDWSRLVSLKRIGTDEIALTRGHGNFVAVISTRDEAGRISVLAVLPDRLKATVKGFLESIPTALKSTIETVCTDMYDGYLNAAYEALPGVTVVVDRFHVAQKYREAVDELRKQELKRLREELSEQDYEPFKGLLWVLRKDWTALSEGRQDRLVKLFKHCPALQQAWSLRWILTGIFEAAETRERAEAALRAWCVQAQARGLCCFNGFIKTLNNYWKEITNYFLERDSSGFVEGLNNKLKVLKRRCYGLDNVRTLFQRLWLDLEGYRLFAAA
jgi:transposase